MLLYNMRKPQSTVVTVYQAQRAFFGGRLRRAVNGLHALVKVAPGWFMYKIHAVLSGYFVAPTDFMGNTLCQTKSAVYTHCITVIQE